jgi:hypothetical protein
MKAAIDAIDKITRRTAADIAFFDRLIDARRTIADQRRQGFTVTANITRDQATCLLEQWLDSPQKEH